MCSKVSPPQEITNMALTETTIKVTRFRNLSTVCVQNNDTLEQAPQACNREQ